MKDEWNKPGVLLNSFRVIGAFRGRFLFVYFVSFCKNSSSAFLSVLRFNALSVYFASWRYFSFVAPCSLCSPWPPCLVPFASLALFVLQPSYFASLTGAFRVLTGT